ncbi:MAG: hypothetical protein RR447_07510 [Algoriella sp.]
MKNIILILLISISLFSCKEDSILNYKDAVVVEKIKPFYENGINAGYYLRIRQHSNRNIKPYYIKRIRVTRYEYGLVNIGDTIK